MRINKDFLNIRGESHFDVHFEVCMIYLIGPFPKLGFYILLNMKSIIPPYHWAR